MSAGPDASADLVAVACVVEASLLIASEWSRVLIEYVYPLLKRLNELHPSHQFRLAFVTYGAADTRPRPLLSKRFFAPLSLVTRELRDEPSKLGIGQTNSGSGRGLSALEGLVAAIELFDILMASINSPNHAQTQSPQKESRSLISHLLHIVASPPDNVQRPQWNTLQHLDSVNWDSIPIELRKRKINLSLISLKKIPQFQDLHSAVAGSGVQPPWFNVHAPHVLLLAGFPTPQKGTKRQTDALLSDHSPDAKRQKVVAEPISKTLSASPSLPSARVPPNQGVQQSIPSHVAQLQPSSVSAPNVSSAQQVQAAIPAPVSIPASTSPAGPPSTSGPSLPDTSPALLEQVVTTSGITFGQMLEKLKFLEKNIPIIDSQISTAENTGQAAVLAMLQKDRGRKVAFRDQIKSFLRQHYPKMTPAKEPLNAQTGPTGPALPDGLAEAGPSTQSLPSNLSSNDRSKGPSMEEHKPTVSDSQIVAQFWQSRGGSIVHNGNNPPVGPGQIQSHSTMTPEMAAQMQQLIEQKSIWPQASGTASQMSGTMSHDAGVRSNNQLLQWNGTFSWKSPKLGGQVPVEVQIHVLGILSATDIRPDLWPKNLTLISCKEPVKDNAELSSWVRRHQPRCHIIQFKPNAHAPDGSANEQKFRAVHEFMTSRRIYAYAGWQLPSGKFSYNMFVFPMGPSFAGAVFSEGIPDLPGAGNVLDVQPSVEEPKTQWPRGLNIPPAILARMQSVEPAKRKQMFTLIRQQLQQAQLPHNVSSQPLNPLGMSGPAGMYGTANIPTGLPVNVGGPLNVGAYNAGGGTVNYEMLQSFMQRSAEGSSSQGMSSG